MAGIKKKKKETTYMQLGSIYIYEKLPKTVRYVGIFGLNEYQSRFLPCSTTLFLNHTA